MQKEVLQEETGYEVLQEETRCCRRKLRGGWNTHFIPVFLANRKQQPAKREFKSRPFECCVRLSAQWGLSSVMSVTVFRVSLLV